MGVIAPKNLGRPNAIRYKDPQKIRMPICKNKKLIFIGKCGVHLTKIANASMPRA